MYGIFTYIWLKSIGNVGKYSIHGASGFLNNLLISSWLNFLRRNMWRLTFFNFHGWMSRGQEVLVRMVIGSMGYNSPTYLMGYIGVINIYPTDPITIDSSQHFFWPPGHPKCGIQIPTPLKGSLSRSQCQLWSSMSMAIGSGNTGGSVAKSGDPNDEHEWISLNSLYIVYKKWDLALGSIQEDCNILQFGLNILKTCPRSTSRILSYFGIFCPSKSKTHTRKSS